MTTGYSSTPLAQKLNLRDGMRVWFDAMPDSVHAEIASAGLVLSEESVPTHGTHAAHIFVTQRADTEKKLSILRELIDPAGFVWVSWPKKASKVDTDITEDVIRAVILPSTDWVDVKVCAVDDTWSGLKLVIRRERR